MAEATPTVAVVAGEASGDLLGAHLIRALQRRLPGARFIGIGGPRMQSAGMEIRYPSEKLAVRGYVEVLRHYPEIARIRREFARSLIERPPALFVGVDAPDFNLDLELRLRAAGVQTAHFVSPSIWAWRRERMRKIKQAVSKMLLIFPFEQALYDEAGVPAAYVGHPLAETLAHVPDRRAAREQLRLPGSAKVVALLPGSRVSEVEQMAEVFIQTARLIAQTVPEAQFLAPMVNRATREEFERALYRRDAEPLNLHLLFGHSHEAMAAADVVLAASGTATLEAALIGRPMAIAYRMPRASYWIMRNRGYLPYVGLPNILSGEFVVPEFLQDEATPENLAQAVLNLMFDAGVRERLEARFAELAATLRRDSEALIGDALLPLLGAGGAG